MKMIEAIIRPERLPMVKMALEEKGFISMTISDVIGRGRQKGLTLKWRSGEHRIEFLPKKKITMLVDDVDCDIIVDTICERAKTDAMGDGKIFILPVEDAVRIRTGDRGRSAL